MRVLEQPCYVLVNRPYSESSWLVDVFSRSYGRQALLAKGARRLKSKHRGMLLPFQPLLISWTGKGEVPTLTNVELDFERFIGWDYELTGRAKICGFYCNELLASLLQRGDPNPALFDAYDKALKQLLESSSSAVSQSSSSETAHDTVLSGNRDEQIPTDLFSILRDFELILISESGYGVSFTKEANGTQDICDEYFYEFVPKRGFVRAALVDQISSAVRSSHYFPGNAIRSLGQQHQPQSPATTRSQSKQIMRLMLGDMLGHKKIMSRDLFFPN